MAPESERAKCTCDCHKKFMSCSICCPHFGNRPDACAKCGNTANPSDHVCEPALTCSEVVERLDEECVSLDEDGHSFMDRAAAEAILHSWRERRVQELEEALRAVSLWLNKELKDLEIVPTSSFGPRSEGYAAAKIPDWLIKQKVEIIDELLAQSDEWREQIRKGAR